MSQAVTHPVAAIAASVLAANAADCQANCSGYLKQVASRLGVSLPDVQADGLIDYLGQTAPWQALANDAVQASALAGKDYFVVAGLKAAPNGHVAVVVPGWAPQGYPLGYWGTLRGAQYAGANQSLTWAWTRPDLARVAYFALPPAQLRL